MSKSIITYYYIVTSPNQNMIDDAIKNGYDIPKSKLHTFTSKSKASRFIYLMVSKHYVLQVSDSLRYIYNQAVFKSITNYAKNMKDKNTQEE